MNVVDLKIKYRSSVVDWCIRNEYDLGEHIISAIVSVLLTRDSVLIGGDFAKSICANDLFATVRYADAEVIKSLKYIVLAYYNVKF